jgi:hypothetical protein
VFDARFRRGPRPLAHLEEVRDEGGDSRLVGDRLGDASG